MNLKQILILATMFFGLLAAGVYGGIISLTPITHQAQAWLSPLTQAGQRIGSNLNLLNSAGSIKSENARLEQEATEAYLKEAQLLQLQAENEELRAQLDFEEKHKLDTVGARVLGFRQDGAKQLLMIDKGQEHNIEVGAGVVARGFLIGQVLEVEANTAVVRLTTDSQFRVVARSLETNATGLVQGELGGLVTMTRIPRDDTLETDDIIVTNNNQEVPRNLPVGIVSSVSDSENSVFKEAQLRLPFDVVNLQTVFIIQ